MSATPAIPQSIEKALKEHDYAVRYLDGAAGKKTRAALISAIAEALESRETLHRRILAIAEDTGGKLPAQRCAKIAQIIRAEPPR